MADNFNQPERDVLLDLIRRDNPTAVVPGYHFTFSAPVEAAIETGRNTLINASIRGYYDQRVFFYDRLPFSDLFADSPVLTATSDTTLDDLLARLSVDYNVRLDQSDLVPTSFEPTQGDIQTLELVAKANSLVYCGAYALSIEIARNHIFEAMLGNVADGNQRLFDRYLDNVPAPRPLNDHYLGKLEGDVLSNGLM